jgi:hypothetical protein
VSIYRRLFKSAKYVKLQKVMVGDEKPFPKAASTYHRSFCTQTQYNYSKYLRGAAALNQQTETAAAGENGPPNYCIHNMKQGQMMYVEDNKVTKTVNQY